MRKEILDRQSLRRDRRDQVLARSVARLQISSASGQAPRLMLSIRAASARSTCRFRSCAMTLPNHIGQAGECDVEAEIRRLRRREGRRQRAGAGGAQEQETASVIDREQGGAICGWVMFSSCWSLVTASFALRMNHWFRRSESASVPPHAAADAASCGRSPDHDKQFAKRPVKYLISSASPI